MSNIRVTILGDASSLQNATRSGANSLRQLNAAADQSAASVRNLDQRFKSLTTGAAVVGGVAAITAGMRDVLRASSEVEQQGGAVDAVFKSQSATMQQAARDAVSLGLATSAYQQQAALLGSQLKNLGIDQSQVAGKTQELIGLGADLAAQFGGSTQLAVEALSSTLRGEYERIERYGITLRQSQIDSEAATKGISKAQATLNLVLAQSADAIGAADREFNTYAATTQRLNAQLENTKAAIGQGLLPVATSLASVGTTLASAFAAVPAPLYSVATVVGLLAVGKKVLDAAVVKATVSLTLYQAAATKSATATQAATIANAAAGGSFYQLGVAATASGGRMGVAAAAAGGLNTALAAANAAVLPLTIALGGLAAAGANYNASIQAAIPPTDELLKLWAKGEGDLNSLTVSAKGFADSWSDWVAGNPQKAALGTRELAQALEDLANPTVYDRLDGLINKLNPFTDGSLSTGDNLTVESLNRISEAIVQLSASDPGLAADKGRELIDVLRSTGNDGPAAAAAIERVSEVLGGTSEPAESAVSSLSQVTQAYKDAKTPVDEYLAAVLALTSPFFAQQQAASSYTEILEKLNARTAEVTAGTLAASDVINTSTGSFNLSTEAGRNAEAAARDLSTTTWQLVAAIRTNNGSTDEMRAKVEAARAAFIQQALQMGLTAQQAAALADQYGLIPARVDTTVFLESAQAELSARNLTALLAGIQSKTVTIDVYQRVFGPGGSADTIERNLEGLAGGVNSQGSTAGMTSVTAQGVTSWRVTPRVESAPQVVVVMGGERQTLRTRTAGSELEAVAL